MWRVSLDDFMIDEERAPVNQLTNQQLRREVLRICIGKIF